MPLKTLRAVALFAIFLSACAPTLTAPPAERPQPRSTAEIAFITDVLNGLQKQSIAEDREYCGYLGLLPSGDFAISPPNRGDTSGCTPDAPPANLRLIASYHSHAAYAPQYDSEIPSTDDLRGDISEGVDGYISTPGGRLWYSDGTRQLVVLLCGPKCIIFDPAFRSSPDDPQQTRYTLAELARRQE